MKRIIAGVMASLCLFGSVASFTGCKAKKARVNEVIKETDTWYSGSEFAVADKCKASEYDNYYFYTPAVAGDRIIVSYNAFHENTKSKFDDAHDMICLFDMEGSLIREIDFTEEVNLSSFLGAGEQDGMPIIYYRSEGKLCKADINKSTGELENMHAIDAADGNMQYVSCKVAGKYAFIEGMQSGTCYLFIFEGDTLISKTELSTAYAVEPSVKPVEGGYKVRMESTLYFFDTAKKELTNGGFPSAEDYLSICNEIAGPDGKIYSKGSDGIYVDGEPFIKYTDMDCSIYDVLKSNLLEVTEDAIVLNTEDGLWRPEFMILHKEASNPNAGKTVIRAASYGNSVGELLSEGIRSFNRNNDQYFVRFERMTTDTANEEQEIDELEKQIKEEIISSDAADIYFNADRLWWFQTDDYFVDLSSEIKLPADTYYDKIIKSASREGKLFYMPLEFAAEGIWTEASNVREGANGFTYAEYEEFVSTAGNGSDAVSDYTGRDDYFNMCFAAMNDSWSDGGKVNIANESFESMCGFFMNVPENPKYSQTDLLFMNATEIVENPVFNFAETAPFDFNSTLGRYKDPVFLGLPTADGRGPSATLEASISISAVSELKDGCVSFVEHLLSNDVQESAMFNPINRTALPAVMDESIEDIMTEYKRAGVSSKAQEEQWGYYKPTEEMRNTYIASMEKVEVVSATDASILAIVHEELSAYLSGQKDIQTVETELDKRLKTLYSEKHAG